MLNTNQSVDLAPLHTFGLKAKADAVQYIATEKDIQNYIKQVQQGASTCLLGEGSNTVFAREHYAATVWVMALKGRQFLGEQNDCFVFRLAAGENWHDWVCWSVLNDYPGLENLALIPGTVGASPIQNIGAYGLEVKNRILAVHGYDLQTGKPQTLPVENCQFSYRNSVFKQVLANRFLITHVDFCLPKTWQPIVHYGDIETRCLALGGVLPKHVMRAVISTRQEKLPNYQVLGNSGSFFKNPIVENAVATQLHKNWPDLPVFPVGEKQSKLAAGWLIEACGLKGHQIGSVQVYPKQALVLTNCGGATGEQLQEMIQYIQAKVSDQFGIRLQPEPLVL